MLPEQIPNSHELEQELSRPRGYLVESMSRLSGDLLILGAGGKMGPSLVTMARRADEAAGVQRKIIAVSRFSNPSAREQLEAAGIETHSVDLLKPDAVESLPDADNVLLMTGMKFGTSGDQGSTWAMNCWLPARVAERFRDARLTAFSTGNVYPLVSVSSGGSVESDALDPVGEYAMSCVGRERILSYFSQTHEVPTAILRLNYACELRYGVLVDLARLVWNQQPVDISMGSFNVIWQADANAVALASMNHCQTPPHIINITGPEIVSVRNICHYFGELFEKPVELINEESPTALLNNAQQSHARFGYPEVPVLQIARWIADWVRAGGDYLGKPTHFQVRDGRF